LSTPAGVLLLHHLPLRLHAASSMRACIIRSLSIQSASFSWFAGRLKK
jgi:hypothetical protein